MQIRVSLCYSFDNRWNRGCNADDVKVVDKVDRDGDGKLSGFSLEVTANLKIDEEGEEYGDGVLGEGPKPAFAGAVSQATELKGDPRFRVFLKNTDYMPVGIFHREEVDTSSSETTFKIDYDYRSVNNYLESISDSYWSEDLRKIVEGERDVTGLKVQYYECDYCVDNPRAIDKKLDTYRIEFGESDLTLETPSKDRSKEVSVTAEKGAELWINGDYKGETPWSGDLPIDISEDELVEIRLEKDGYVKKTVKEDIDPPESIDYNLEKVKKPLVVNSDPEGATVRIDGTKIGETPVSKKYWVKEELDIRVEGENRTEEFDDVSTPWQKTVDLSDSDSSGTGTGSLYDYGTTYDFTNYDSLLQDIDLTGLTQASFNASTETVNTGEEVRLDASGSYSIGYNITGFSWDLGDGSSENGEEITHSYSSPGTYTVNLTVENDNGTRRSTTKKIKVENIKPEADFSIGQNSITPGQTVTFNAAPSRDPGGSITSYSWKIDAQSTGKMRIPTTRHVFSQPGEYQVELTVFDNSGASGTETRMIDVRSPNVRPQASFTVNSTNVDEGEKIRFDASSSSDQDRNIQTYAWDLGNGLSRTGQQLDYSYNRSGNFTVKLSVIDARGLLDNATKKIRVESIDEETDQSSAKQSTQVNQLSGNFTDEKEEQVENMTEEENEPDESESGIQQILIQLIRTIF